MRSIVQRVSEASVSIDGELYNEIKCGALVFIGVSIGDTVEDIQWMVRKIANMRIFSDEAGKMNQSLKDINGEVLVISQFTLCASTRKGNRPSFTKAAPPEDSKTLYQDFVSLLNEELGVTCKTGEFGADMQVALINDGPVTIVLDSVLKE